MFLNVNFRLHYFNSYNKNTLNNKHLGDCVQQSQKLAVALTGRHLAMLDPGTRDARDAAPSAPAHRGALFALLITNYPRGEAGTDK